MLVVGGGLGIGIGDMGWDGGMLMLCLGVWLVGLLGG